VLLANERALAFWQSCIGGFARFDTSSWTAPSGRQFTVLRFESSASSGAGAKVAEPLAFRPVDFARDAALCARFKRDAYVCSFGSDALFVEHFGSDAGYLDSLRARVAVHVWRGREIVGQLDIALSSDPDPQPSYVSLFYLIESERGTDAGDALHAYALERLRQHGAARAELHVSPTNARALRYYLKHGWRDLGPEPSGEVHRMRLALS
jgi:GNAT superfamily N-acetyltransferase